MSDDKTKMQRNPITPDALHDDTRKAKDILTAELELAKREEEADRGDFTNHDKEVDARLEKQQVVNVYDASCCLCKRDAPRMAVSTLSARFTLRDLQQAHGWVIFTPSITDIRKGRLKRSQVMILCAVRGIPVDNITPQGVLEDRLLAKEYSLGKKTAAQKTPHARKVTLCEGCGQMWSGGHLS